MADPVRLYSPNPDAPQYVGMGVPPEPPQPWYRGMGAALQNAPNALWMMLPPEARKAYSSGFNALVDMTTPAAVRDYTTAAQDTARSATQGDGWGTATNALATVNAALGAIPVAGMGIRAGQKVARDVGKVAGTEAQNFIRAYHGSPHDFDKFSLSKIGTGEGAQAYGHGLYFAENEGVAKGYRDTLTKSGSDWGQRVLDKAGGDIDAAIAAIQAKIAKYRAGGAETYATAQEETLRALQQYKQTGAWSPGRMYEVAIHADPAKFLDWDKPLHEQTPYVQDAVTRAIQEMSPWLDKSTIPNSNGPDLYHALGFVGGENKAKGWVDAGIPGIKYLDAASRVNPTAPLADTTNATRNYVVFNDQIIEILRKYGLLPVAGAAGYAAMPGQEDNSR